MRTLTVDTRGLLFSLRFVLLAGLLVGAWYAWLPFQQLVGHTEPAVAGASNSTYDDAAIQAAIERLLATQRGNTGGEQIAAATALADVPVTGRFIIVDTDQMTVELYESGARTGEMSLVHVPPAEAPNTLLQGTYTVDFKTEAQLSTVTLMRFPYYVKFGDRYALHGTPTDAQGAALAEDDAGGSVELATNDARELYAFVVPGTEVVVRAHTATGQQGHADSVSLVSGDLPATTASAYAVTDVATAQTFIVKNSGDRYPIASITKLFTAAVASDGANQGDQVRAPNGQYYTVGDLYYPLLLRSDNGVAQNIAAHIGTNTFLATMNAFATVHDMRDTSFRDASGLSPHNVSSANDLTLLARYLYQDKPFLLDIASEEHMTITSSAGVRWRMSNQNKFAADPYFRGGKLGYTDEAGQTGLSLFNLPLGGETHTVSVVVLGSRDWKQDTRTLLRWLVKHVDEQD